MSAYIKLTIDLGAIAENWRRLAAVAHTAECAAAVKANAYGLGLSQVAPTLFDAGCRSFFVAHLEEGLELRGILQSASIYVLNGIIPGDEREAFQANLIPVVNGLAELAHIKHYANTLDASLPIALHIDTGIHRLGLDEEEVRRLRDHRELLDGIRLALIMSHLVVSENPVHPLTKRQYERFCKALETLPSTRTSLCNSAGIFHGAPYHLDMVRPGAALYGINPKPYESSQDNPMLNVTTLEARILQIHDVKAGETVGYGADFIVDRPSRIATVSIGYADGVPFQLGNRGFVCAAKHRVPIVGRVSMDLMTIDVSALQPGEVKPGDFVEVLGRHRTIDEIAAEAGTISYDVLTGLGKRATRVYETSSVSFPTSAARV